MAFRPTPLVFRALTNIALGNVAQPPYIRSCNIGRTPRTMGFWAAAWNDSAAIGGNADACAGRRAAEADYLRLRPQKEPATCVSAAAVRWCRRRASTTTGARHPRHPEPRPRPPAGDIVIDPLAKPATPGFRSYGGNYGILAIRERRLAPSLPLWGGCRRSDGWGGDAVLRPRPSSSFTPTA